MITVACVKSKPNYDHHYVNRLYEAVERNLTIPHRFVCLTDDNRGLKCQTKQLFASVAKAGWWAKMALFKVFTGPTFYLDLDTLILGNLDFIADYQGKFAILRDFYRPEGYGSGVMMWNEDMSWVWDRWVKTGMMTHALGDQGMLELMIDRADRLQDVFPGKIVSYKVHCADNMRPKDASIMCFHGDPKPHDFPPEHWIAKEWTR